MIRKIVVVMLWTLALNAWLVAGQASVPTAVSAKAFVGVWIVAMQGARGAQERTLTISDGKGKLTAELGGGRGGPLTVTDTSIVDSNLVLKWSQGAVQKSVDVVMTLSVKNGALIVTQELMGGRFRQTGTGRRKG